MARIHLLLWPIFLLLCCSAQTITLTDQLGQTIVEVATTNLQGLPTTRTLLTLTGTNTGTLITPTTISTTASTSTTAITPISTSTSSTTTPPAGAGPVGQPAATTATPGAPTPFTYTTIINGQTIVTTDVFTPTNPATTPVEPTMSGTIWNLSSYLSQYGHATSAGVATFTCLGVATCTLLVAQIAGLFYDLIIF